MIWSTAADSRPISATATDGAIGEEVDDRLDSEKKVECPMHGKVPLYSSPPPSPVHVDVSGSSVDGYAEDRLADDGGHNYAEDRLQ